jgi:hypothetical protein
VAFACSSMIRRRPRRQRKDACNVIATRNVIRNADWDMMSTRVVVAVVFVMVHATKKITIRPADTEREYSLFKSLTRKKSLSIVLDVSALRRLITQNHNFKMNKGDIFIPSPY